MDKEMNAQLAASIRPFHLPAYGQLPDMGLYLEQVTFYLNQLLSPLGFPEITGSMIRNYVKKGLVANPVNKRYYADHLAYLIAISLLKHVLPLENIQCLFARQQKTYTNQVAYDYFCNELENMLFFLFGLNDTVSDIGVTSSLEKQILTSTIYALCNIIYSNSCFRLLRERERKEPG